MINIFLMNFAILDDLRWNLLIFKLQVKLFILKFEFILKFLFELHIHDII